MLRKIAQLDSSQLAKSLLVTLTYPHSFPKESSTYKRHFQTFSKRLRRTFPHSSAIGKLEFQKRGAPHYHLIVLGVPFMARQWLAHAWTEVVNSGDAKHLRAGTQVVRCHSSRKAITYAAKYVAKISQAKLARHLDGLGCHWAEVDGYKYAPVATGQTRICETFSRIRNLGW